MTQMKDLLCSRWLYKNPVSIILSLTTILLFVFYVFNQYKEDIAFNTGSATYTGLNILKDEIHGRDVAEENSEKQGKFQFLENYKNPCWYEPLPEDVQKEHDEHGLRPAKKIIDFLQEVYDEKRRVETNPQRLSCFPYFILIGAPKCGSTDLFSRIAKHPDVTTPPRKENHWWSRLRFKEIAKKNIPLEDYAHLFGKAAYTIENHVTQVNGVDYHPLITGEGSVSYLWDNPRWETVPENKNMSEPAYIAAHYMQSVIPDVKLLVILRNPVKRLFSGYMFFNRGFRSADLFHKYAKEAVRLYTACFKQHSVRYCVYNSELRKKVKSRVYVGIYVAFLEDWFKIFPRNQFMILRTESYSKNIAQSVTEVYKFLQLRSLPSTEIEEMAEMNKRMKTKNPQNVTPHNKTLELLRNFYLPFNRQLATLLNDEEFLWN